LAENPDGNSAKEATKPFLKKEKELKIEKWKSQAAENWPF